MNGDDKWQFIVDLDGELLKGGVILSEWCATIVRETDCAFVAGASLATVITATAAIETYLRSEYGGVDRAGLYQLIEISPLRDDLKRELHALRKYRNKWVHVVDPWDDAVLQNQSQYESELESMAVLAVRSLRKTIYENQWV